jgi:signal transduction histidine kinase
LPAPTFPLELSCPSFVFLLDAAFVGREGGSVTNRPEKVTGDPRDLPGPGTELERTRSALKESRAEAAGLSARLRAAEQQLGARRTTALSIAAPRRSVGAEDDEAILGAAFEDLWALAGELEEANATLGAEVAKRRAQLATVDAALRRSEDRVRLAHRYAGAGAWDWEIGTGAMSWSEEHYDLLGLPRDGAPPSYDRWLDGMLPEDREATHRALQGWLDSSEPEFEVEYRVRHPQRGVTWIAGRGRLDRGGSGRSMRATGLCIDITARKRAELALRDANENLRREVEREMAAREAAQTRLTQTMKLEALGRLTGGVAHDFNNLLAVVTAGVSLLTRTQDPARCEKIIDSIAQAARRGADLTRRLLTFARRQALRPEAVDLRTWLPEIGEFLSRSLRADIAIEIEALDGLWPVLADPSEMELAVLNLAFNGRDAMPRGGTLRISARNSSLAGTEEAEGLRGEFLRLDVSDTGTGMSAETLARVFEPFFTTKQAGHGTGLGLAQVYGFARQSGGAARVSSAAGRGTTVSLLLPRAPQDAVIPSPAATIADPGRALRILVVEDDDAVAALVLDMLRHLGHAAVRAANAAGGLKMLENGQETDLVFTDVLMPGGMDGLDLAQEIARRRPGLPVLLTSGYGGAPARVAAAGLPLLRKPYNLEQLRKALASAALPQ